MIELPSTRYRARGLTRLCRANAQAFRSVGATGSCSSRVYGLDTLIVAALGNGTDTVILIDILDAGARQP